MSDLPPAYATSEGTISVPRTRADFCQFGGGGPRGCDTLVDDADTNYCPDHGPDTTVLTLDG